MVPSATERDLYRRFATLLAYPTSNLATAAGACAAALDPDHPEAAGLVRSFARFAEMTSPSRVEEIYSGVFELDAATPPYVGYHLFGESYKRSAFLLGLGAACREAGIDCGTELADHLVTVLALLAKTEDEELGRELMEDALVPALERMVRPNAEDVQEENHARGGEAYLRVLRALQLALAARAIAGGTS